MSIKSNLHRYAVAGAFTLMAATPASANMITAVTGLGNTQFAGAAQVVVPGMTSAPFFNPAGARFVVTFSAECSVNAPAGNNSAWTDVDIVVLNFANVVVSTLAPTAGAFDAFCASDGTVGFSGWASHSVTALSVGLPAGNYRVQVRARLNGGATGGWFGERSLVVSR